MPVPSDIVTLGLSENLVDDPIATEAMRASAHFNNDPNATYIVLTPPRTIATGQPVYRGYHTQTTSINGLGNAYHLQYAFIPFLNMDWPGFGTDGCGISGMLSRVVRERGFFDAVVAALALAALASASAPGGPELTPAATLLARLSPVVVLHPDEELSPVPVDGFLADSDLKAKAPDGTWAVAPPGPLPTSRGAWRLDQRLCAAKDGLAATSCYAQAEAAHGRAPTVYGAVFRRKNRIALQYWFFYPYNPYSPAVPQTPDFWQVHEGDWELVTVLLDATDRPLVAGYSRHCAGARRVWAKVPKRGLHPVVYVALGSHANYFAPGSWPQNRRCWPREALSVLDAYKRPVLDFTAAGLTVSPSVVRLTATSPSWMRFPGTWGEDQFIHFPNATFIYGTSPTGPGFKKIWRDPIGTPLSWPRG